jgi:hypothetical protein
MVRPSNHEYALRSTTETELVDAREEMEALGEEDKLLERLVVLPLPTVDRVVRDELDISDGTSVAAGGGGGFHSSTPRDTLSLLKRFISPSLPLPAGDFDEKEKKDGAGDVARERSVTIEDLLFLRNDAGRLSDGRGVLRASESPWLVSGRGRAGRLLSELILTSFVGRRTTDTVGADGHGGGFRRHRAGKWSSGTPFRRAESSRCLSSLSSSSSPVKTASW